MIVSDRQAPGSAARFAGCPQLAVLQRCAMDMRHIDVGAVNAAGVRVTHASAGQGAAVAEWVFGALIDLRRGIRDSVLACRTGTAPAVAMGGELQGAMLGVIGYARIGRRVCQLGPGFGLRVPVADPLARVDDAAIEALARHAHVITRAMIDGQGRAADGCGAQHLIAPCRGAAAGQGADAATPGPMAAQVCKEQSR